MLGAVYDERGSARNWKWNEGAQRQLELDNSGQTSSVLSILLFFQHSALETADRDVYLDIGAHPSPVPFYKADITYIVRCTPCLLHGALFSTRLLSTPQFYDLHSCPA
ncbi:hypothetical protein D9757_011086 [Collybiopsis confluens]|uniref:Uncharacterized protein n=1 Tax=Collybiopsis confluens TaxID=2823264 RepID=A0A8H5GQG6_9AGAR|nr:hypothetical protein D9757_011086 [Collybiopsis confluens]